jgi:outer membrane receptor protein involved in Fe transport
MTRVVQTRAIAIAFGFMAALAATVSGQARPSTQPAIDLGNLSLEELLNLEVQGPAGLTAIDSRRMLPVDLTELDARDVQRSGARDLNHLLENYVPNAQLINHQWPQAHLGFQGIISDREDKYLYQVNGLTMNNRMLLGADNERALPLMGDINVVNVVRGPASATHGAGALAGVVDVETYNGLTLQGLDVKVRQGAIDRYTATELRYGRKLTETSGLFMYYGLADVRGADSEYFIGRSFPAGNGLPANVAGQPFAAPLADDGEAAFGALWHKAHVSYVHGPFEIWTRFVQDGGQARPGRDIYTGAKPEGLAVSEWTRGREVKNRQITVAARLKLDLSRTWNLELLQSDAAWLFTDRRAGTSVGRPVRHASEDGLFSRAIARWTPNAAHSLAFGTEYSPIWFSDPPQSDALDRAPVVTERDWQADTISFLFEDQWKINEQWTTFLSFRTDKNTYSDWLVSPRGTLVYAPTKNDTFKFMAGQSVRRGADEELWGEWKRNETIPRPETLRTYEISYARRLSGRWIAGVNGLYEDYDALGWIPAQLQSASLGRFQMAGGDVEITYRAPSTRLTFSEGVTKLVDSSLPSGAPAAGQGFTSQPYGFGNDLANWATSVTKLTLVRDIDTRWTVSSSVTYYSAFNGGEAYANYAATLAIPPSGVPLTDPGNDVPFGPNLFANLGMEYRPSQRWTIRMDGYNLAAPLGQSLSKRNYILRTSEYSGEPAGLGVSVAYHF